MIKILEKLIEYDKIILITHKRPDMDALGSQMGMKYILKENFPTKQIYASGEVNKYDFNYELDILADSEFKDALVIVLDSGSEHLIYDQRYDTGEFLIKFDHHINNSPYGDICYVDESKESCAGMVVEFAIKTDLKISKIAAKFLYTGLVTDSGRFLYSNVNEFTFKAASLLIGTGIDISAIYDEIYKTTVSFKKLQGYVLSNFTHNGNAAYMKYSKGTIEKFNTTLGELKSGTVNLMSNLEGINVWATFTEYEDKIFLELRGSVDCLDIAVKYGGGGHLRACGATLSSWKQVDEVIKDMLELK